MSGMAIGFSHCKHGLNPTKLKIKYGVKRI